MSIKVTPVAQYSIQNIINVVLWSSTPLGWTIGGLFSIESILLWLYSTETLVYTYHMFTAIALMILGAVSICIYAHGLVEWLAIAASGIFCVTNFLTWLRYPKVEKGYYFIYARLASDQLLIASMVLIAESLGLLIYSLIVSNQAFTYSFVLMVYGVTYFRIAWYFGDRKLRYSAILLQGRMVLIIGLVSWIILRRI